MRKTTKNKSSFLTDDSLFKLLYLVVMIDGKSILIVNKFGVKSKKSIREWKKPYDGKIGSPQTKSKKWFVFSKQENKINNII